MQIWENYVEGQEVSNGAAVESKQKEVLKVIGVQVHPVMNYFFSCTMVNDLSCWH